jgi:hypothetical protein
LIIAIAIIDTVVGEQGAGGAGEKVKGKREKE